MVWEIGFAEVGDAVVLVFVETAAFVDFVVEGTAQTVPSSLHNPHTIIRIAQIISNIQLEPLDTLHTLVPIIKIIGQIIPLLAAIGNKFLTHTSTINEDIKL